MLNVIADAGNAIIIIANSDIKIVFIIQYLTYNNMTELEYILHPQRILTFSILKKVIGAKLFLKCDKTTHRAANQR
jgi:hypothetical protein